MTTGQNNSDSKGFNRSDEGNLVKTAGTFRVFSMLWDWCQDKQVPCHLLITCARDRILVGSPRILTVGNHSHQSNYEHVMREHWAPSGENLQSVTPHFVPLNQTSVSTSWTLFNSVKKKKKKDLKPIDAKGPTAGPVDILRFLEALGCWASILEIEIIVLDIQQGLAIAWTAQLHVLGRNMSEAHVNEG